MFIIIKLCAVTSCAAAAATLLTIASWKCLRYSSATAAATAAAVSFIFILFWYFYFIGHDLNKLWMRLQPKAKAKGRDYMLKDYV